MPSGVLVAVARRPSLALQFVRQLRQSLDGAIRVAPCLQIRFGLIQCQEKFHPRPLPAFPQRKGFPYRLLRTAQPAVLNGLTDKRLLFGRKLYFHRLHHNDSRGMCQWHTETLSEMAAGTLESLPHRS